MAVISQPRYRIKDPEDRRLRNCWIGMHNRCANPRDQAYKYYGARGIRVCAEWDDYGRFTADVGSPPSPKHSLDRIDNNGDYCPGNVRWATSKEQSRNTRRTRLIPYQGRLVPLVDLCGELNLCYSTVWGRLKCGFPPEQALDPGKRKRGPNRKPPKPPKRPGWYKLDPVKAHEIRRLAVVKMPYTQIASRFGVSRRMVEEVVGLRRWNSGSGDLG